MCYLARVGPSRSCDVRGQLLLGTIAKAGTLGGEKQITETLFSRREMGRSRSRALAARERERPNISLRIDTLRPGYRLVGCSPAEPTSISPGKEHGTPIAILTQLFFWPGECIAVNSFHSRSLTLVSRHPSHGSENPAVPDRASSMSVRRSRNPSHENVDAVVQASHTEEFARAEHRRKRVAEWPRRSVTYEHAAWVEQVRRCGRPADV